MPNQLLRSLWLVAACVPSLARAQQPANRSGSWEFSAGAGVFTIDRAFNREILVPMTISQPNPSRFAFGGALRLGYNVTRSLGFSVGSMFSTGSGASINSPFVDLTWTPSLDARTSPFFMIGAGVSRFSTPGIHETSSFGAHFGIGIRHMVTERLAVRLEGRMQGEQFEELRPGNNPAYNGAATLGLSYFTAGRSRHDADGDGVIDRRDRCPDTPRGAIVDERGCPRDSDHDGVVDGIDRCPNTPANTPVDQFGCARDTDGDGVADNIDRCPNTPANTRVDASGCPIVIDTDRDGVPDSMDRCPNSPAGSLVDEHGCPRDSDADGVPDNLDRCPNTPPNTRVDANGCTVIPDTDKDGVPDDRDRCPNSPVGKPVDSVGCTIIALPANAADQMVLRVQFVTNRATLVRASTVVLDSVATAILASPGSLWEVQGFTDTRGTVRANQLLSQARAQAVVDYLVSKGVARSSMTATGFASQRAVGSNRTAEGQAANRRVQLRRRPAANPVQLP